MQSLATTTNSSSSSSSASSPLIHHHCCRHVDRCCSTICMNWGFPFTAVVILLHGVHQSFNIKNKTNRSAIPMANESREKTAYNRKRHDAEVNSSHSLFLNCLQRRRCQEGRSLLILLWNVCLRNTVVLLFFSIWTVISHYLALILTCKVSLSYSKSLESLWFNNYLLTNNVSSYDTVPPTIITSTLSPIRIEASRDVIQWNWSIGFKEEIVGEAATPLGTK